MHPSVFESISGIKIRSTNEYYGQVVYIVSSKDEIEVPADDDKYLYSYRWHRVGASGQEYLYSNVDRIYMTDSIHYKAELIKLPKEQLEIAFTVTGFESGKSAKDIKIKTPNNCFTSSVKSITLDGNKISGAIKESGDYALYLNVAIADTGACANDSLVNVVKFLGSGSTLKNAISLNGIKANGKDDVYYDGNEKEGQLIYTKTFTAEESSSSSVKSSSSSAKSSSSVKANSSSSAKAKSSSSSGKAKSSSSNKNKDALPAYAQIPHFTLTTVGRDIQVAGVRIGSAYEVFDLQGHVIVKGRTNAANFNLTMNHAGIYLVKIGNQAQKVQVK